MPVCGGHQVQLHQASSWMRQVVTRPRHSCRGQASNLQTVLNCTHVNFMMRHHATRCVAAPELCGSPQTPFRVCSANLTGIQCSGLVALAAVASMPSHKGTRGAVASSSRNNSCPTRVATIHPLTAAARPCCDAAQLQRLRQQSIFFE